MRAESPRITRAVCAPRRGAASVGRAAASGYAARVPRGGFRLAGLLAGLAAFAALWLADGPLRHFGEWGERPAQAAAVSALMAIWWLSGALPLHWTACVPLAVFPWTGVFGAGPRENAVRAALPYVDPYNFLFLGGLLIAAAMQQWGLHRRIALGIMRAVGADPARLLLGFLAATAFISLWITNTATATMMFPIGMAVIAQFETRQGRRLEHWGAAVMLAVAYASNVGGIGTKVGTVPNSIFAGFMARQGVEISFLEYAAVGVPFVLLFLPVVWLALWRIGRRDELPRGGGRAAVEAELSALGPVRRGERAVLAVFVVTAALWVASRPLADALGPRLAPWRVASAHVEAGVAMLAGVALLLLPVEGTRALELRGARAIPWRALLLLGGSFSMAASIDASGLSRWLGGQLAGVRELPALAQIVAASVATTALSAVASNIATIAVMLNVLQDVVSASHAPAVLFAATIASSCDFALPAGTPPNAIAFGSGYVTPWRMAKTGVGLDLAGALLAAVWCWLVVGRGP
jgi:sodium-dependent dicarboxylate transporter 2/3/5